MQLYLVRHAQSHNNANIDHPSRYQADPPLTELGHRQAKKLADYLVSTIEGDQASDTLAWRYNTIDGLMFRFDHIICSPMYRTLQTAKPLMDAFRLPAEVWIDIHERGGVYYYNQGEMHGHPGMSRTAIQREFPDVELPTRITHNGWWRGKRESREASRLRAVEVEKQLRVKASGEWHDKRIVMVSHGGFIDMLVKVLLMGISPDIDEANAYFFYNSSISRIDFWPNGKLGVRYMNRIDHLPPAMVS